MSVRDRWVLTGPSGRVGRVIRPAVRKQAGSLVLLDQVPVEPAEGEEARQVDLLDQEGVEQALDGADGIIHLAAIADEADFHDLADVNIVGTYHVLEAARRQGVRRVVLASSNRVTGYYPTTTRLHPTDPPRPDGVYGVSKVAVEALGRLYADKFGLEVVCLRIGSFADAPTDERHLSTWLSHADGIRAFTAAMTGPVDGFACFYAVSRNTRRWWDLDTGEAMGFSPEDDAEAYAALVAPAPGTVQGGRFADPAFTTARQRH